MDHNSGMLHSLFFFKCCLRPNIVSELLSFFAFCFLLHYILLIYLHLILLYHTCEVLLDWMLG